MRSNQGSMRCTSMNRQGPAPMPEKPRIYPVALRVVRESA
jgi:hypothetical protein